MKTEILGKGARGSNFFFYLKQNVFKHLFIQRFWDSTAFHIGGDIKID